MPTWEVNVTSTSVWSFTVEAETESEAFAKGRATPEKDRGGPCTDWDFDVAMVEEVSESDVE